MVDEEERFGPQRLNEERKGPSVQLPRDKCSSRPIGVKVQPSHWQRHTLVFCGPDEMNLHCVYLSDTLTDGKSVNNQGGEG